MHHLGYVTAFSLVKPFNAELLSWACASLHLEKSIANLRNIKIKTVELSNSNNIDPLSVQMWMRLLAWLKGEDLLTL